MSAPRLIQSGPRDAKLAVVGEAPGAQEDLSGRPFAGASGEDLDRYLRDVGINRDDCFVTNVVHTRPPNNKFDVFIRPTLHPAVMLGVLQLKRDLEAIRPNLVLALGDTALRFLCNKQSIMKYRGSILESSLVRGQKVIATYHPASVFRQWENRALIMVDMKRVAEEMRFPEIKLPERNVHVWRPDEHLALAEEMFHADWLAIDIETDDAMKIVCVGFSDHPSRALVIPVGADGAWPTIRRLCASPARKVMQNAQFDLTVLADNGVDVANYAWDTLYSHHALLLESAAGTDEVKSLRGKSGAKSPLSRGLAFQASIYTREPFWKDDGKVWKLTGDMGAFYRYNGTDAAVTHEIRTVHERELTEFGTRKVFDHEMQLQPLLMAMSRRGIRVDLNRREALRTRIETEIQNLQGFLDSAAGAPINVKSAKQIQALLYGKLGLPEQHARETGRPTADKDAILRLAERNSHPVLHGILEIRKRRDLIERYLDAKVDADGRIRCLFDPSGTRTGRLASRANIYGSGSNLQNLPPQLRSMFIADEGKILFSVDLSQAEARMVAYLARCEGLISLFDAGRDVHKENAIRFFGEYKEENRTTVKRIVHGSNYGEGPDRIVQVAAADGIRLNREDVVRGQDAYFMLYPEIKEVYWADVTRNLRQSRTLTTPLGWKRQFYGRWSQQLINSGLAHIPQSTVGILTQMGMMKAAQVPGAEILLNIHDSIVGQCDEHEVGNVVPAMIAAMQVPVEIHGKVLVIPADAKTGVNLGDASDENPNGLRKWKQ